METTLVLQSHRNPLPHDWLDHCLQSVRDWASHNGYAYRFIIGDELFTRLPAELQRVKELSPVIASDLARLLALRDWLRQGYRTVIWCDADFLVFDARSFRIIEADYALGREVWIQRGPRRRLKTYTKLHNAFLMFRQGNSLLDFYIDTAQRLLRRAGDNIPPQFIGPKLLTALHNIADFPVQESAGMLSPLVIQDLIKGGGDALDLFKRKSRQPIKAANLCASSIANGDLTGQQMRQVIDLLPTLHHQGIF